VEAFAHPPGQLWSTLAFSPLLLLSFGTSTIKYDYTLIDIARIRKTAYFNLKF
jgi:hypothetical protein